jgi:hypothetical protein
MTADAGPLAAYRAAVVEAVGARIESLNLSHAELMRAQLRLSERDPMRFLPAALCLLTAEALGADRERAMPAAVAFALIEAMAEVFQGIGTAREDTSLGLKGAWGLPRTLNTGDALYALAQRSLLELGSKSFKAQSVAEAGRVFDSACRRVSEALFEQREDVTNELVGTAVRLGSVAAGVDIEAEGHSNSSRKGVRERIDEATRFIEAAKRGA